VVPVQPRFSQRETGDPSSAPRLPSAAGRFMYAAVVLRAERSPCGACG